MIGAVIVVPRPSFSPLTVFEMRFGASRPGESNGDRLRRLARTYGLDDAQVRLLVGVADEYIDTVGRVRA